MYDDDSLKINQELAEMYSFMVRLCNKIDSLRKQNQKATVYLIGRIEYLERKIKLKKITDNN